MQEVIKFKLQGISAVIRKPESNTLYFTYNNVHKIMILGILGAIIGKNGYNYSNFFNEIKTLPEFYESLKEFKIAVKPNSESGSFSKKVQQFNNSVGYASQEDGNNLIVTEQWLENPSWYIYILENNTKEYLKLKEYLLNSKCEYIPYMGKNEHFADISKVEILTANNIEQNINNIHSLFTDKEYENTKSIFNSLLFSNDKIEYEFKENMPTKLDLDIGYTEFKEFTYTNKDIKINNLKDIYSINDENIYFF